MNKQELTISGWLPQTTPNAQRRHWRDVQKRHHIDRDMAWASAKQAGWVFVPGKVRLEITLVYPRKPVPDVDNAYARCKGLIDGLKAVRCVPSCGMTAPGHYHGGFFTDDSPQYLDLHVEAIVEQGVKAVRMTLETDPPTGRE